MEFSSAEKCFLYPEINDLFTAEFGKVHYVATKFKIKFHVMDIRNGWYKRRFIVSAAWNLAAVSLARAGNMTCYEAMPIKKSSYNIITRKDLN